MKSSVDGWRSPTLSSTVWTTRDGSDRLSLLPWVSNGEVNTTTSPRCGSWSWYETRDTSTRSPTSRVWTIDSDGMKNAWATKVFTRKAMTNATPRRSGNSRRSERGFGGGAAALAADDHTLEDLDPFPVAFDDPDVDFERVAGPEAGDVVAEGGAVNEVGALHGEAPARKQRNANGGEHPSVTTVAPRPPAGP